MQEMLIQIQIFVSLNRKSSQSISTKHLQTNVIYFETLILEYRTEISSEGVQTLESLRYLYQPAGAGWKIKYIQPELDRWVKISFYFSYDLWKSQIPFLESLSHRAFHSYSIFFSGINKIEQTKGPLQSLFFVCVLGEVKRWGQIFPMSKNFMILIYHLTYCNPLCFPH